LSKALTQKFFCLAFVCVLRISIKVKVKVTGAKNEYGDMLEAGKLISLSYKDNDTMLQCRWQVKQRDICSKSPNLFYSKNRCQ